MTLFLLYVNQPLFAANLKLQIADGLPSDVEQNIKGHLGRLPETVAERTAFLYKANKSIETALQALGYYRSNIKINTVKPSFNESDNENKNEPWLLIINLILNERTHLNQVVINTSGDAKNDPEFNQFLAQHQPNTGSPLNHGDYEQFKSDLLALGLNRGYFDGKIIQSEIKITPALTDANIMVHYDSGQRYQYGKTQFQQTSLEQGILDKLLTFKPGDPYLLKDLQNLQASIEQTGYFGDVIIAPDPKTANNYQLPINIDLKPTKRHLFNVGLGYSTDTKFRQSISWKTPLINRYGHKQETKIEHSNINPSGQFTYTIPLSDPINHVFQFKLLLANDEFGDIKSTYWANQFGVMRRKHNIRHEYYFRYMEEDWTINDVDDDANYLILGYSWSKTKRKGSVLDPTSGFSQYYNLESAHSSFGSETSFVRFNARWKFITTLAKKHRIVARAEIGAAELDSADFEALSPSLRFFAGGDQSIRGFAYQSIGPKETVFAGTPDEDEVVVGGTRLAIASIEYQYYFTEKWRAALFADGGSVHDDNDFDAVYSIGPGIHYISPIGAIRLNVGYGISEDNPKWRIHFNVGAEF